MSNDAEFITRLSHFGLGKKEAQLYLHLLKHGPRTPSPIAKALNTYRTDVHRTLISLIEKGMVRASFDSRTVYAAIDLDAALDSTVKKHECELRKMEARKRELQELAKQEQFRPSDEVSTFRIIKRYQGTHRCCNTTFGFDARGMASRRARTGDGCCLFVWHQRCRRGIHSTRRQGEGRWSISHIQLSITCGNCCKLAKTYAISTSTA